MKDFDYSNEYGSLTLIPISDFVENMKTFESTVTREDKIRYSFDCDQAEKMALITHNAGIQISFFFPIDNRAYVIVYDDNGRLALGRVEKLIFTSDVNPAEELDMLNNMAPYRRFT